MGGPWYINLDHYSHGVMSSTDMIRRYWYLQPVRVRIVGGKKMWYVQVTGWEFDEMFSGVRFKSKKVAKRMAEWIKINVLYFDTPSLRLDRMSERETAEGIVNENS